MISFAYPAISPWFVTLIEYLNLTVNELNFFLFNSTLTTGSGSCSGVCPVCVTVSFPFSTTIACVTHFLNAKSKYVNLIYSLS